MNSFIYPLFFFVLIYIESVRNYPDGAPPSVCGSMMPGHGVGSQQCSTKYTVQSNTSHYYPNQTVRITVSGSTSGDTFEGVLLIAKTQTTGQIIGKWTIMSSDLQTLACDDISNTGVTHTSNSVKSSIQAIWYPPSTVSTENTIIKATIVHTKPIIYVNCFSVTLTNRLNNQSTNGTVISTTSTGSAVVATTTVPQTRSAGVSISWTYASGVTTVSMQINNLETSQWLALGLSLDQSMGNDHVFACKRLADDTVTIERFVNPGGHTPPVLASTISNPGGTFNPTLQKLDDGVVYCSFTLSNFGSSKRRRRAVSTLSQSTIYYPLIATGNLDSSNQLTQHTIRTALSQTVQLNQQETILYNGGSSDSSRTRLVKAHGIIMIFTWILCASTGILCARYFKTSWPEKKLCGKALWFVAHRGLMSSVAILTIIAFIIILVYENGKWIPRSSHLEFAHSIVGIIVICFAMIQPIMALFRCKPDAEYRFIFNYAHAAVGSTAFLLSIVAIFLAMFFTDFTFRANREWGLILAWTCWVPVIFLIFWFVDFYFQKNGVRRENDDAYDLGYGAPKDEAIQVTNTVQQDRIKLGLLFIHIVVALGIAIALASVLGRQ